MPIEPLPPETARGARAACPKGTRYLRVADERDRLFTEEVWLALFPSHGQPARPPWRLALVTLLPCAEGLSDRQAANAVRGRLDGKDVFRRELTDPGFDGSGLREFRARLLAGAAESRLFETVLTWCRDRQRVKARGRPRTDSTPILAAGRALNRLDVVGETLRHALHTLAGVAPQWVLAARHPDGKDREARRAEDDRLPTTHAARAALALTLGHEGWQLLSAVDHADAPAWRREVPAVAVRRRVWLQHYLWDGRQLPWREAENLPPAARFISSPSDAEAPDARKHTPPWVGSKGPITETCEDDLPHLLTPIATTPGPASEGGTTPTIHAAPEQRGLLPGTPIVDPGFLDADLLVKRRDDSGVDLLGPTRLDSHGQAREGAGFDAQQLQIDGHQHQATGPAGKTRISWTPALDNRKQAVIKVKFATKEWRRCGHVRPCLRSQKRSARRTLTLRPQPQ